MKKIAIAVQCCAFSLSAIGCGENSSLESDAPSTEESSSNSNESENSDSGAELSAENQAILSVKAYVAQELENLHEAAVAIQDAAPEPDSDGWNATDDEEAVLAMRGAWKDARDAYERIEGAIAVLFPNYDASTDERYDGFIEEAADENLFDGEGVTGVHAIERILWAGEHPQHVLDFESALPNYAEAAFPASKAEATDFVDGLAQRLVDDTAAMASEFEPLALDAPSAFRGVIGSMLEQSEKIALAATGEDESRYAQYTLGDMRANAEGGQQIFEAFLPWLDEQGKNGKALGEQITEEFGALASYYGGIEGDAIPEVPETWNQDAPSEDDLETDYGQLYLRVTEASDAEADGSLVQLMLDAADLLGIADL